MLGVCRRRYYNLVKMIDREMEKEEHKIIKLVTDSVTEPAVIKLVELCLATSEMKDMMSLVLKNL